MTGAGGAPFSLAVGAFTTKINSYSQARATAWGLGNSGINAIVNITWTSAGIAKNFFDAGGQIRLRLSQGMIVTTQDFDWQTTLAGMGTLILTLNAATKSGGSGTLTSLGYNQLTGVAQTIYTNFGGGPYAPNEVIVTALVANGGQIVQFGIGCQDAHVAIGAGPDSVNAGTTAAFDVLYIGNVPGTPSLTNTTGVAPIPVFSTVQNF